MSQSPHAKAANRCSQLVYYILTYPYLSLPSTSVNLCSSYTAYAVILQMVMLYSQAIPND